MDSLKESFNQPPIEFTKTLGLGKTDSPIVQEGTAKIYNLNLENNFYRKKSEKDILESYEFDLQQFKRHGR